MSSSAGKITSGVQMGFCGRRGCQLVQCHLDYGSTGTGVFRAWERHCTLVVPPIQSHTSEVVAICCARHFPHIMPL